MVDKQEAIRRFIKDNLKIILDSDFPEKVYDQEKKKYFSGVLRNAVIVKDREIAKETLEYLLKTKIITNHEQLQKLLQAPKGFIRGKVDSEYFEQKLNTINKPPDFDIASIKKHIKEQIQKDSTPLDDKRNETEATDESKKSLTDQQLDIEKRVKLEEPKEQLKYTTQDITPLIEDKRNEIQGNESNKSLTDQQADIQELVPLKEIIDTQPRYEPWWRTLGLTSDPFPTS